MTKRILLTSCGASIVDLDKIAIGPDNPFEPVNPSEPIQPDFSPDNGNSHTPDVIPGIAFDLTPVAIPEYTSLRYDHAITEVTVSVPDGDMPRVAIWVTGSSSGGSVADPSDTLIKRMTTAAIGAAKDFHTAASHLSLFTSPFRIGWAWRLKDGSHIFPVASRTLCPNNRAPLLALREMNLVENSWTSRTEIFNDAFRLTAQIPPVSLPEDSEISHIDFYITNQVSLFSGEETVTGIRSYTNNGETLRCWSYDRLAEDIVLSAAEADSSFRVIGSVEVEKIGSGTSLTLPTSGSLDNWKNYPTLSDIGKGEEPGPDNPDQPDNPDTPDTPLPPDIKDPATWPLNVRLTTGPIDLGDPICGKWVKGVSVCGAFDRTREGISVMLQGSHHRQSWRTLARADGAHIRRLRGVRYRWYRVRIDLRRRSSADLADALIFEY